MKHFFGYIAVFVVWGSLFFSEVELHAISKISYCDGFNYMIEGTTTRAPKGYVNMCHGHGVFCDLAILSQARLPFNLAKEVSNTERDIPRNANNQVLLDKLIWLQLQQVNRIVNSRIYPGTDEQIYGSADYWAVPTEFGDCEDYVLAKKAALIALGWPAESLMVGIAQGVEYSFHAVLIVETSLGDFVLDNQREDIVPWCLSEYRWVIRQSSNSPGQWVRIVDFPERSLKDQGRVVKR